MNYAEALDIIKDEKKIFDDQYYTKTAATYAAIVMHPKKPFEYAVEFGRRNAFSVTIGALNKQIDLVTELNISNSAFNKIFNQRQDIIKNNSFINKETKNYGLTISELKELIFNNENLINTSQQVLDDLFYKDSNLQKGIKEKDFIFSDEEIESDAIEYLCTDDSCGCCCSKFCCDDWSFPHPRKCDYLEGGVSIGPHDEDTAGTMGGIFKCTENNIYGISNSHVFGRTKEIAMKKEAFHPSLRDIPKRDAKKIGKVIWAGYDEYLDVAFIKLNCDCGKTVLPLGNYTASPEIEFKNPIEPAIGMGVKKCGRSTGFSRGEILSVNATVDRNGGNGRKNKLYRNQIMTNAKVCKGDSGSLLVSESNHVVGLINMKNNRNTRSFANPIKAIFERSDIKLSKFINFKNN